MTNKFIVYNPRCEEFKFTNNLREYIADINYQRSDIIVSDIEVVNKFIDYHEANGLLLNDAPEKLINGDSLKGYSLAFSFIATLANDGIKNAVVFDEKYGEWSLEVECLQLKFLNVEPCDLSLDKETGELVLSHELESICESVDETIKRLESKKGECNAK